MKTLRSFYASLIALSLVFFGLAAFAADGGAVDAGATDGGNAPAKLVDVATNPNGFLAQIWAAVTGHRYGLASVLGAIGLVSVLRWVGPKLHGAFGAWLNSNRGGAVLALFSGCTTAAATTLLAGQHLTPTLLFGGFTTGVMAIGGWNAAWDLLAPADKKAAQPDVAGEIDLKPPTPPAAAMLLPFLLVGALATQGCAFGACELKHLPQTLQTAVSVVTSALAGATWEQDLLQAGQGLASGQLDCILTALAAPPAGRAAVSASHLTVMEHAKAALAKRKPSACKDLPALGNS